MTAPEVRRRPGRPRKYPLPEPPAPSTEVSEATSTEEAEPTRGTPPPSDPKDPRIGLESHPTASHMGFDDGSLYEVKDGFVVKRVD